jgi:hypothetical protein
MQKTAKSSTKKTPVLKARKSTSTPAPSSDPSTSGSAATTASVVMSTAPPDMPIPTVPAGFIPVDASNYRGFRPKAAQLIAFPDAILELESATTYEEVFGTAIPSATDIAEALATASSWTAFRVAIQALLIYAKSLEAITWKTGLTNLEKLEAVYHAVAATNPAAVAAFPALQRVFEVSTVIAAKVKATRARNIADKAAKAANSGSAAGPATTTVAAPVAPVTPPASAPPVITGTSGTGSATH